MNGRPWDTEGKEIKQWQRKYEGIDEKCKREKQRKIWGKDGMNIKKTTTKKIGKSNRREIKKKKGKGKQRLCDENFD